MLTLTIDNLPCVAITPELADELSAMGEDVHQLNRLTWPAGASQHGRGVFLMHSDEATKLARDPRSRLVTVRFSDDSVSAADGTFSVGMYQIEHRPVHVSTVGTPYPGLYAVTLVDARYFWQGVLTTASFDVTTTGDRTTYYDETKNSGNAWTWPQVIAQLAGILGITVNTSTVTGTVGDPTDYLMCPDAVGITLDRICAALGMLFVAGIDGTYSVVAPQSLNSNALKHNDQFLRERVSGGVIRSAGSTDGQTWLDTVMPSTVKVLFPRQVPAGTDAHDSANPPPLRQFYVATSTAGKPAGTTGRTGYSAIVNDALWAVGAIGSETNATALQSRADYLAAAFYNRYQMTLHNVRLMGFLNIGVIAGVISWQLTAGGGFTDFLTRDEWGMFGGNQNVGDGFTGAKVIGLGGIQTHKTFDGGLIISGTGIGAGGSGATLGTITASGTVTATKWNYTCGAYTICRNLAEPCNGTPGRLGVNVGTNGTVNGGSCVVQPIGIGCEVMLYPDPTVSGGWMFSMANSAQ